MAELLNLRQAARLIGVSPGRLYRAITTGRLPAEKGGGPGKTTLVSVDALHTFCAAEGLPVPERPEHVARSERSTRPPPGPPDLAVLMQYLEERFTGHLRYVAEWVESSVEHSHERLIERLERTVEQTVERAVERAMEHLIERLTAHLTAHVEPSSERATSAPAMPPQSHTPAMHQDKAAVLTRLRTMQAEGLSLQAIANRLNAEGIPTLSGRGLWKKGTISNLLSKAQRRNA